MRSSIGAVMCVGLVLLGAGCDPKQVVQDKAQELTKKAEQSAAERALKIGTGKDVKVDLDQKGATFVDPSTGHTFAIGEKVTIPATFPKDVPVYPAATPTSIDVTSGSTSAGVLLVSPDKRKDVQAWYASETVKLGWTSENTYEAIDHAVMSFTRDEHGGTARFTVTLSSDGQGKTTIILARKGVK